MAYGGVEGTKSLKASLSYIEGVSPHSVEHVDNRNLDIWSSGIPDDGTPLYDRMRTFLDKHPNNRRQYEAYNYLISFDTDEFNVDNPEEVEQMKEHVRDTCKRQFGNAVPYVVHVQGDGEGGKLHAHITALNIDLKTGKSIRDYTGVYNWRKSMNDVTNERDELNKTLEYPDKNARVIESSDKGRKKQNGVRNQWRNELIDTIDNRINTTTARTFEKFVEELSNDGVRLVFSERSGKRTLVYEYAPPGGVESDGKIRAMRRSKSSHLGTDYMSEGIEQRFEGRQQTVLANTMAIDKSFDFDLDSGYTSDLSHLSSSAPALGASDKSAKSKYNYYADEKPVQKPVQKNVQKTKSRVSPVPSLSDDELLLGQLLNIEIKRNTASINKGVQSKIDHSLSPFD